MVPIDLGRNAQTGTSRRSFDVYWLRDVQQALAEQSALPRKGPRTRISASDGVFLEMLSADRDVALVSADFHLCAFFDHLAGGAESKDHGGFPSAMADGLDFDDLVG